MPGVVLARRTGDGTTAVAGVSRTFVPSGPLGPTTATAIGSNTKTMTAVVVLQLVAEGQAPAR